MQLKQAVSASGSPKTGNNPNVHLSNNNDDNRLKTHRRALGTFYSHYPTKGIKRLPTSCRRLTCCGNNNHNNTQQHNLTNSFTQRSRYHTKVLSYPANRSRG